MIGLVDLLASWRTTKWPPARFAWAILKAFKLAVVMLWRRGTTALPRNAVHCPVCGRSFGKFYTLGRKPKSRRNALCPFCDSRERSRLTFLFLATMPPPRADLAYCAGSLP